MTPLPPESRAPVVETIRELEQRAAAGEVFARLALPGWYQALAKIDESETYYEMGLEED